jgi:hypothetical protein
VSGVWHSCFTGASAGRGRLSSNLRAKHITRGRPGLPALHPGAMTYKKKGAVAASAVPAIKPPGAAAELDCYSLRSLQSNGRARVGRRGDKNARSGGMQIARPCRVVCKAHCAREQNRWMESPSLAAQPTQRAGLTELIKRILHSVFRRSIQFVDTVKLSRREKSVMSFGLSRRAEILSGHFMCPETSHSHAKCRFQCDYIRTNDHLSEIKVIFAFVSKCPLYVLF